MLVSICSREFGDRESSPGYADYGNLGITIKEALLNSLYRLLQQHKYMPHDGHVGPYVVRAAPAVAFMMLSFLHSRQASYFLYEIHVAHLKNIVNVLKVPCIREQAELLLQCLYSLDPSWVHVMFTAAGGGHDAENMWNELTSDPRLDPIFFAICDFLGTTVRTAFSRRQVFLMFLRWMRLDETFRHHLDKLSLLHSCSPRQIKKGSDPNAHVDGGIVDAVLGADKRWQRGIVQWAGI